MPRWLIRASAAVEDEADSMGRPTDLPAPVPGAHLALVGDNPEVSFDSRQMGPFPVARVLGTVRGRHSD